MKLAMIIFFIAVFYLFFIKRLQKKQAEKYKAEKRYVGKEEERVPIYSKMSGYAKKNSFVIICLVILAIVFANFIYPGNWFVAKKIHLFFLSTAERDIKKIAESEIKRELSSPDEELKRLLKKSLEEGLSAEEKKRVDVLGSKLNAIEKKYDSGRLSEPEVPNEILSQNLRKTAFFSCKKPDDFCGTNPNFRGSCFRVDITANGDDLKLTQICGDRQIFYALMRKDSTGAYVGQWKFGSHGASIYLAPKYNSEGLIFFFDGKVQDATERNIWVKAVITDYYVDINSWNPY